MQAKQFEEDDKKKTFTKQRSLELKSSSPKKMTNTTPQRQSAGSSDALNKPKTAQKIIEKEPEYVSAGNSDDSSLSSSDEEII